MDLYRRDFTINALAFQLNPKGFGELIDYFGGVKDIKGKVIRFFTPSFVEDPTGFRRFAWSSWFSDWTHAASHGTR
jgi:tRNA nucleotidyltransferase (CCA-adding enzyme)